MVDSPLHKATSNLLIMALYFCLRSCEYLLTPQHEHKKTQTIALGGIRFFRQNSLLSFYDPALHLADFVSVTLFDQKNGEKLDTVNVDRAHVTDTTLCCVRALSTTVQRIISYDHSTPIFQRKISMFRNANGSFTDIASGLVVDLLRLGATRMGPETLGFQPTEIGTHSIRSGGAMAYYLLPELSDTAVMFFGRWKSLAFLKYIRTQVDRFHKGHSTKIALQSHFFTVPSLDPAQIKTLTWGNDNKLVDGASSFRDARLLK